MKQLTDTDPFPFGKYKGMAMEKVPSTYLDWLMDMPWIKSWPEVEEYIERNRAVINNDLKQAGIIE